MLFEFGPHGGVVFRYVGEPHTAVLAWTLETQMKFGLFGGARLGPAKPLGDSYHYKDFTSYVRDAEQRGCEASEFGKDTDGTFRPHFSQRIARVDPAGVYLQQARLPVAPVRGFEDKTVARYLLTLNSTAGRESPPAPSST